MSDIVDTYAVHGCPKTEDGVHVWTTDEDGVVSCEKCGQKR